jgi:hypothetical protein
MTSLLLGHALLLLIAPLVELLGHDDWPVREMAQKALIVLNNELDLRFELGLVRKYNADAEVRRRARRVLEKYGDIAPSAVAYYPRIEFMRRNHWDPDFNKVCSDCGIFLYHYPDPSCYSLEELYDHDCRRREASSRYVRLLFGRGLSRRQVQQLLDLAIRKERSRHISPMPMPRTKKEHEGEEPSPEPHCH